MTANKRRPAGETVAGVGSGSSKPTLACAHDFIEICAACRSRLGEQSFRGTVITAQGLAAFRLCHVCRFAADDAMLARIMREAEQRLLVTGPAKGHA